METGTLGHLTFAADALSIYFATFGAVIWVGVTIYSLARGASRSFLIPSAGAFVAVMGIFFAGDLLTLFLFFEALALLGFLLVRLGDGARAASIRYFWTMLMGGLVLLAGILTGETLLLLLGFGVKAGMLPVHGWLPAAHGKAPPPASALLSGVIIKTGIYGIIRIDPGSALLVLGLGGAVYGAALALVQSNAKRLLAWSSVSQVGVILVGVWAGSLGHIATHAWAKALLFMAVGAVLHRTGTVQLDKLGGLWRSMPVTFGLAVLGGSALIGLPILRSSAGKSEIHHAMEGIPELLFFVASAGTVAVVLRLVAGIFLGRRREGREAPMGMLAGMTVVALPLVLPAVPHDLLYFGMTVVAGTVLFLATRRWVPSSRTIPMPTISIPDLPRLRIALPDVGPGVERYTRETGANLALLFAILLLALVLLHV
jgi:hydrogenase-4 component B